MKDYILLLQTNNGAAMKSDFNTIDDAKAKLEEVISEGIYDPIMIYKDSIKKVIWEGDSQYCDSYIRHYNLQR